MKLGSPSQFRFITHNMVVKWTRHAYANVGRYSALIQEIISGLTFFELKTRSFTS